eukprot:TRINITY_DN12349_c0_g1_i2.p1 TRINITY_DN12349_c0_g1~~TRINITY_DN12349_c0_g1_i2.p1  ORF type:complete len:144 (-),score=16.23 TRINITY_DN12349_c0_g1_i2:163-594(-)
MFSNAASMADTAMAAFIVGGRVPDAEERSEHVTMAVAMQGHALGIQRKVLKKNHPDLAKSLRHLGTMNLQLGVFDKATEYFTEALKIASAIFQPGHPRVQEVLAQLNSVKDAQRAYKDAKRKLPKIMKDKAERKVPVWLRPQV